MAAGRPSSLRVLRNLLDSSNNSFLALLLNPNPRLSKTNATLLRRCFFNIPNLTDKTQRFSERKIVGFSMEQIYMVVSEVDKYKEFVPFCKKSDILKNSATFIKASLEIGFPPIQEKYISAVTLVKPYVVKAVCTNGVLFNHLITNWQLGPGLPKRPDTCLIDFSISFEFRSVFYSSLAKAFFDEVVCKMSSAFIQRAELLYGPPASLKNTHLKCPANLKSSPSENLTS